MLHQPWFKSFRELMTLVETTILTHHSSVTVHWVYILQIQTSVLSTIVSYMHVYNNVSRNFTGNFWKQTATFFPNLYLTFFSLK